MRSRSSIDIRSRMAWRDTVIEAAAAISQRPARAALTALGTILGVGAFVVTTGLAETAQAQVSSRFDALKATEVRIRDAIPDGSNPFPVDVDERLQRLNGVKHAGLLYAVPDFGRLEPRNTAARPTRAEEPIPILAASPGALVAARPTMLSGRLFDDFLSDRAERVAVVGRDAAERLGIVRVDNQPVVFLGDNAYIVVGVIADAVRYQDLNQAVIIPVRTEQRYVRSEDLAPEVLIDTAAGAADLVGRQAPTALRPNDPDRLMSLVPPSPDKLRNVVESDITDLYYSLSVVAIVIGCIAIANAMLLTTIERRPEIGLRRALGARRRHIARQIVVEASMIGVFAGFAGASLGMCGIGVFSWTRGWTMTIDIRLPLLAPLLGLVTGALAGLLPAVRAARTPPAITLRA